MKNLLSVIVLIVAVLSSCSDGYLDPEPISEISSESFYASDEEIQAAVNNIYDGLQSVVQREFALTEMRSDNSRSKSSEGQWAEFDQFALNPQNTTVADYWALTYNTIFRTNTVLEHLDGADEDSRPIFEGEARFVHALCYFNLVRLFGGVPLIDKVIELEEDYYSRVGKEKIMSFIILDLEFAVSNLPDGVGVGRASKRAAQTLLAHVYLNQKRYDEAKLLLDEVLALGTFVRKPKGEDEPIPANVGEYSLLEDEYNDVFYKERNPEIIFAVEFLPDTDNDSQDFSSEFTPNGRGNGLNYATANFVTFLNGEIAGAKRLASSIVLDSKSKRYQTKKFESSSSNIRLSGNDWVVYRYADVLLMYVEAILKDNLVTDDADAVEAFNAVTKRAGTAKVTSITKERLLDERRAELGFENKRLFDLIRFGVADTVLGTFADTNGYSYLPTDKLLPIPSREIGVSKDLLGQNPGY